MVDKKEFFKKRILYYILLCFFTCLCLCIDAPVFAADEVDSGDEFTLEEITVTAEKREAEVQKIPIDIAVVRPDDMSRLGVYTTDDLDKIIPELNTEEMGGSFLAVTIRNVTTNAWNMFHETTVAMHLDGVQLTRPNGINNFFYDLQRVEVLKGPQGTLYGRGSTAGTMNIVSQKPILNEFSGHATLQAGTYDLIRSELAVNIPTAEKLALRMAGRTNRRDGYDDSGYGNQHAWAGRISMNWEPSDNDQVLAVFDFEGNEDSGNMTTGTVLGAYGGLTIMANPFQNIFPQNISNVTEIKLPYQTRWLYGDWAKQAYSDLNAYGLMLEYDHSFASIADLTVIYGYRSQEERKDWVWANKYLTYRYNSGGWVNADDYYAASDPDATYLNFVWAASTATPSVFTKLTNSTHFNSLEARLLSKKTIPEGDRYEWVLGVMSQHDTITTHNFSNAVFLRFWNRFSNNSKAAFAQAQYAIFKDLTLTGGYRKNIDQKQYAGAYQQAFATDPSSPELAAYIKDHTYDYLWRKNTYKTNLTWFVSDSVMSYLQFSKGYKSGNLNFDGTAVPPEILNSWETGIKSRFFDNRLQFNTSVYLYDYKNYNEWATGVQTCYSDELSELNGDIGANGEPHDHYCDDVDGEDGDGTVAGRVPNGQFDSYDYLSESFIVSPGGAKQYGASTDITWLVTPKDTLRATATWSYNEYKNYSKTKAILAKRPDADSPYTDGTLNSDLSGEEFSRGAPLRGNISYTHMLFVGMDMVNFNVTGFYNGEGVDQIMNNDEPTQYIMKGNDDYWTLDASISYGSSKWLPEGMNWNARFQVNNIFDSQQFASITYTSFEANNQLSSGNMVPGSGTYVGTFIEPRTMSLTFTINF